MAVHHPADYNIFSLVTIEDKRCSPDDEFLIKAVSDKIRREFIATAEDDKTLRVIFDLEQKIGKEITWVAGDSFDTLIRKRKYLPNKMARFCTTELKMRPIFDWWKENINEIVRMQIGIRYDEKERADNMTTKFKTVVGKSQNGNRNKWDTVEWREIQFPLIAHRINHWHIRKYWKEEEGLSNHIQFPDDSNCVGCFWKDNQQLRKNWEDNPEKLRWFAEQENDKMTWKTGINYDKIAKLGIQQDFNFGTGSGCQAGYCTD